LSFYNNNSSAGCK